MKDHRMTIRLSAELRRRVKDAARRDGTPESDVVRRAVEQHFSAEDSEMTAYELAQKAGLIGIVRGASRDLSTNRKYFDGFGRS